MTITNGTKMAKKWRFKLHTGELMPMIGFGTSKIGKLDEIKTALDYALGAGYRHIDTAQSYGNEPIIGEAIKELLPKHNLTRKDIFITTKLQTRNVEKNAYEGIKESLKNLQTDYLDLFLIHNPAIVLMVPGESITKAKYKSDPSNKEFRAARWREMVQAHKEGLVRNIGVSNYAVKHLKELLENDLGVKPTVNQIQWHPFHHPEDILSLCQKENMLLIGWSSLGGTNNDRAILRENSVVKNIADKLGKSTSQVLLRWALQQGVAVLPKSLTKKHIEENLDLNFEIPEADVEMLNSFEQKTEEFGAKAVLDRVE